jgi:cytochrome c oxidase accessory protein FixG
VSELVQLRSSLRPDGSRNVVYPADVRGRFASARKLVFLALIGVYLALPWIPIGGHPAVFLDVVTRHFYLFGMTFNAQDVWMMTFLLLGGAFSLVYVTSLAGRVWCGWACPQTVFLEGVYRRLERFIEGPREQRVRRAAAPWGVDKLLRRLALHAGYFVISALLAHVFLSYFVSLPALFTMVRKAPAAHPEAFGVAAFLTGVLYFDFAWFREQFCVVLCPYGRLQSVLLDQGSLVIGYDRARGEPRGKVKDPARGACVDCNRCVTVCPTGIDIRNGLQLDCIACTACIDACDEIMDKVGQPRGLIRYDSQSGLAGLKTRMLRPRVIAYTAVLLLGAAVASLAFRSRTEVEANLLRLPGAPFVLEGDRVRNSYELHLVNKRAVRTTFRIVAEAPAEAEVTLPLTEVTLDSLGQQRLPVFVSVARAGWHGRFPVRVHVVAEGAPEVRHDASAPFLGP